MSERVSMTKLAAMMGISRPAVAKHVKAKLYKPGRDGLFDAEACIAAWQASRDPDAVLKGQQGAAARRAQVAEAKGETAEPVEVAPLGAGENSLTRARAAQATVQAERQALALARERGEVIAFDAAVKACLAVVSLVNERLDGAAGQIGARAAGKSATEVEAIAREVIRSVRAEVAALPVSLEGVRNGR